MDTELYKKYDLLSKDAYRYKNYQSTKNFINYAESILNEPSVIKDNWHDHVIEDQLRILAFLINACPDNERKKWVKIFLEKIIFLIQKKYTTYIKSNEKVELIANINSIRQISGITRYIRDSIKKLSESQSIYSKLVQYEDLFNEIEIPSFVPLEPKEIKKKFNKIAMNLSSKYNIQLFRQE